MSISAQELKKQIYIYYEKLDLVIEQICRELRENIKTTEQKCQEDLICLTKKRDAIVKKLKRKDNAQINRLNHEFQTAKKELEACINDRKFLNELEEILVSLYPILSDHIRVIDDIGLNKGVVNLNASSTNVWHDILDKATKNDKVTCIIQFAIKEYSSNVNLLKFRKKWRYDFLIKNYEDRYHAFQEAIEQQKNRDYVAIANKSCNYDEQKAILESKCHNAIKTIEGNLHNIQAIKVCWQIRLTALGEELITSEETVISSSFDQSQSFEKIKQILQDPIASEIKVLHSSLVLIYTVYCIFLKGHAHDLLEIIESPAVNLDLLGGTLHSRLLYDSELNDLRLEFEELLQPPYITAWHKLPEDSTISDAVIACAISPEGNWVLTTHKDKTLKLWDVTTGLMEGEPLLHKAEIYDCALSYNGVKAVTASADGLRLWHLISSTEYDDALGSSANPVIKCCVFNQDSTQIIWGKGQELNGWIKVLDDSVAASSDYDSVTFGQFHNQIIHKCAWAPHDQRVMAIAGSEIKIWDIKDETVNYTFFNEGVYISCCAWGPDGTAVVLGALDHKLKIWEISTNKVRYILEHTAAVTGCVWSKSGQWIVSVSDDKTLKVWDANTGNCISTFYADRQLTCCAIHEDTQLVIAGGHKGVYWLKFNYNSRKDTQHV